MVGSIAQCNSRPEFVLSPVSNVRTVKATEWQQSLATNRDLNIQACNVSLNALPGGLHRSCSESVITPSGGATKFKPFEQPRHRLQKTAYRMLNEDGGQDSLSKMIVDDNAPGRQPLAAIAEIKCLKDELEQCKSAHALTHEELQLARAELRRTRGELRHRNAAFAKLQAAPNESNNTTMQQELERLRSELHNTTWALRRLEGEQEKEAQGYRDFIGRMAESSSQPLLDQKFELSKMDMLGAGKYGYVMSCADRETKEPVVVKLQSLRWTDVAVKEWTHSSEASEHRHVVKSIEVFMHNDESGDLQRRLATYFENHGLVRHRPKRFPTTYLCMALEYMDCGSLQSMMDFGLLAAETIAAVTRQVASAVAFMHSKKKTHNDIKPDNILLKRSADGNNLIVKLADFGLAEHSVCQTRDFDLLAYTIWCMGTGAKFVQCPREEARTDAVVEFKNVAKNQANCSLTLLDALADVVAGLWCASVSMTEVEERHDFQNCEVRSPMGSDSD